MYDALGPLEGYRVWSARIQLRDYCDEVERVHGLMGSRGVLWTRPHLQARCEFPGLRFLGGNPNISDDDHEAPVRVCKCGIYAMKRRQDVELRAAEIVGGIFFDRILQYHRGALAPAVAAVLSRAGLRGGHRREVRVSDIGGPRARLVHHHAA